MIYSINFSGTYGPPEMCGAIPPGIYDLMADSDGHYRSCVPALPTKQFSGLSVDGSYPCATMVHCPQEPCVTCLDLFIRGENWILTDGIYEWTCHVVNWDSAGSNRMFLTGGCDICSDKPYEILVVATPTLAVTNDWSWPSLPPDLLIPSMKFGDGPSDSCTGWYCCQENRQVVLFNNCTERDAYVCSGSSSSSSSEGIITDCCPSNAMPQTITVTYTSASCAAINGVTRTLTWDGLSAWVVPTTGDGFGNASVSFSCFGGDFLYSVAGTCPDGGPDTFSMLPSGLPAVDCGGFTAIWSNQTISAPGTAATCCDAVSDVTVTFAG